MTTEILTEMYISVFLEHTVSYGFHIGLKTRLFLEETSDWVCIRTKD